MYLSVSRILVILFKPCYEGAHLYLPPGVTLVPGLSTLGLLVSQPLVVH